MSDSASRERPDEDDVLLFTAQVQVYIDPKGKKIIACTVEEPSSDDLPELMDLLGALRMAESTFEFEVYPAHYGTGHGD